MEEAARSILSLCEFHGLVTTLSARVLLGFALLGRGRWDEARAEGIRAAEDEGRVMVVSGIASGLLLLLAAYEGASGEVQAILGRYQPGLALVERPLTLGQASVLTNAIEGLAVLGERDAAAALYDRANGLADAGCVQLFGFGAMGLLQTTLGIAAACRRRWELAVEHFETALHQAHELPNRIAQPETRRWYAWMLLERDAPGDREKARTLLTEAVAMYRQLGMPKHLEMAEALLEKAGGP